jgi:hypothetical protein
VDTGNRSKTWTPATAAKIGDQQQQKNMWRLATAAKHVETGNSSEVSLSTKDEG